MPAQILATGSTAASSADVAVTSTLAVALRGLVGGKATVTISLKDEAGNYHEIGALTASSPATVIAAPGSYRFTRREGETCGVFSG